MEIVPAAVCRPPRYWHDEHRRPPKHSRPQAAVPPAPLLARRALSPSPVPVAEAAAETQRPPKNRPNPRQIMTRLPPRCRTSIIQSAALVQGSFSLSTPALAPRSPEAISIKNPFRPFPRQDGHLQCIFIYSYYIISRVKNLLLRSLFYVTMNMYFYFCFICQHCT